MPRGVPASKEHLVAIDNNALWRNPRVVECPGALVSLLLFHVIEGNIILLVLCGCVCVYIFFFYEYDVCGMCSSLCSCICMSNEHACDSL